MTNLTSQLQLLSDIADALEEITTELSPLVSAIHAVERTVLSRKQVDAGVCNAEGVASAESSITEQVMALRYLIADVRHQQDTDDTQRLIVRQYNDNTRRHLDRLAEKARLYNKADCLIDAGSDFD